MNSIFKLKSIEEQLIDHIETELKVVKEYTSTIPLNGSFEPHTHLSIDIDDKTEKILTAFLDHPLNYRKPFFFKVVDLVEISYYFEQINNEIKLMKSVIPGVGASQISSHKCIALLQFNKLNPLSLIFKDVN